MAMSNNLPIALFEEIRPPKTNPEKSDNSRAILRHFVYNLGDDYKQSVNHFSLLQIQAVMRLPFRCYLIDNHFYHDMSIDRDESTDISVLGNLYDRLCHQLLCWIKEKRHLLTRPKYDPVEEEFLKNYNTADYGKNLDYEEFQKKFDPDEFTKQLKQLTTNTPTYLQSHLKDLVDETATNATYTSSRFDNPDTAKNFNPDEFAKILLLQLDAGITINKDTDAAKDTYAVKDTDAAKDTEAAQDSDATTVASTTIKESTSTTITKVFNTDDAQLNFESLYSQSVAIGMEKNNSWRYIPYNKLNEDWDPKQIWCVISKVMTNNSKIDIAASDYIVLDLNSGCGIMSMCMFSNILGYRTYGFESNLNAFKNCKVNQKECLKLANQFSKSWMNIRFFKNATENEQSEFQSVIDIMGNDPTHIHLVHFLSKNWSAKNRISVLLYLNKCTNLKHIITDLSVQEIKKFYKGEVY
jgi:hypothetical protein